MKKTLAILLLALLVVGCGKSEQTKEQPPRVSEQEAIAWLEKLQLGIDRDFRKDDDGNVIQVTLREYGISRVTDAELFHLRGLTKLERIGFHGTQVTDAGLVHLKGLTQLKLLYFNGTLITDAGLVHLQGLTNLEHLDLRDREITDAGLVHLKGLTKLEELYLNGTQVTDAGVAELKKALPNCEIEH